jgi:ATP-independent RNA helicase DbpA
MAVSLLMSRELSKLDSISQVQNKVHQISSMDELTFDSDYDQIPPMVTIFISGGRKDKLRPGDIVGAIVGEAKVEANVVGDISIMNINTFVAVKREVVDIVIEKLNNGKIKNRKFRVGLL